MSDKILLNYNYLRKINVRRIERESISVQS